MSKPVKFQDNYIRTDAGTRKSVSKDGAQRIANRLAKRSVLSLVGVVVDRGDFFEVRLEEPAYADGKYY